MGFVRPQEEQDFLFLSHFLGSSSTAEQGVERLEAILTSLLQHKGTGQVLLLLLSCPSRPPGALRMECPGPGAASYLLRAGTLQPDKDQGASPAVHSFPGAQGGGGDQGGGAVN